MDKRIIIKKTSIRSKEDFKSGMGQESNTCVVKMLLSCTKLETNKHIPLRKERVSLRF